MKTRHLVLGFAIVLALSLTVPALGGPLGLRSGGSAGGRSIAEKALKRAADAQQLLKTAQTTAGSAQNTASAAQNTASSARSIASGAQASAAVARAAAGDAQNAANRARSAANAAEGMAGNAVSTAEQALTAASSKFGHVVVAENVGGSIGNNEKRAIAQCPENTIVAGGGFVISNGAAEPHVNRVQGNSWVVIAQSGGNPFGIVGFAYCLAP